MVTIRPMIKFIAETSTDRMLLGFGLSAKNIERLMAGEEIRMKGEDLGLDEIDIVFLYGRTEQDMVDQLTARGVMNDATPTFKFRPE